MRTAPLGIRRFGQTLIEQHGRLRNLAFDASRLIVNAIGFFTLSGELLPDGPRPGPHRRILDGDLELQRGRVEARPPLDRVEVLARSLEVALLREVGRVDDE